MFLLVEGERGEQRLPMLASTMNAKGSEEWTSDSARDAGYVETAFA